MNRSIATITVLIFGLITAASVSAQGQPGQGRGRGFGGGRGLGPGQGFGRNRAAAEESQAAQRELSNPVIAGHGAVVQLPDAAQQPRSGTKLLVNLTAGSDADQLNAGLEKVAKYLNIFAGGGAKPAEVKIAVVFHGDATLAVLNQDAYAKKFNTDGNPNLKLLEELQKSGVELYVCGQSLISKGSDPKDVSPFVQTAVSALTAVVNLQTDGYAYVPSANAAPAATPEPQVVAAEESHDHGPLPGGGMGRGMGRGMGAGMGRGPGAMQGMQEDMTTLHAMFADRDKIKRTITNLPDGAEAVTESDDEAIASMLKEHVPAMEDRVLGNKPLPPMTFHPIFVALIKHADDYTLSYEETDKGIKVRYQSDDPYVVMLVQEHAKLVSRFIKNGMEEIHTPYTLPNAPKGTDGR
jgi:intracellular sulfur oxidation DsrE/DsrF family protein